MQPSRGEGDAGKFPYLSELCRPTKNLYEQAMAGAGHEKRKFKHFRWSSNNKITFLSRLSSLWRRKKKSKFKFLADKSIFICELNYTFFLIFRDKLRKKWKERNVKLLGSQSWTFALMWYSLILLCGSLNSYFAENSSHRFVFYFYF